MNRLPAFFLLILFLPVMAAAGGGKSLPAVTPIDRSGLLDRIRADSGRVVIVNTWASWCKPCQEELPALVKIAARFRRQNPDIILVAIDEIGLRDSVIRPMLARAGVSFPSFLLQGTADDEFINSLNPSWSGALPATFLYDTYGKQSAMLVGGKSYKKFLEAVSPLFGAGAAGKP
jgi:thiol-disulfide isomerase/thioredoxin